MSACFLAKKKAKYLKEKKKPGKILSFLYLGAFFVSSSIVSRGPQLQDAVESLSKRQLLCPFSLT